MWYSVMAYLYVGGVDTFHLRLFSESDDEDQDACSESKKFVVCTCNAIE